MISTKNKWFSLFLAGILAVGLVGCDSDDPDDDGPGEEEFITSMTITLSPDGGGDNVVVTASDPDGDGAGFEIDTINLVANTMYTGTVVVSDDINNEDITEEIEEEADEHQFFFTAAGGAIGRVTVDITDLDSNGFPVGLEFTLAVSDGAAASGTMQVVLSHYDEGPKDGVTPSDESDIDVVFPVEIAVSAAQ